MGTSCCRYLTRNDLCVGMDPVGHIFCTIGRSSDRNNRDHNQSWNDNSIDSIYRILDVGGDVFLEFDCYRLVICRPLLYLCSPLWYSAVFLPKTLIAAVPQFDTTFQIGPSIIDIDTDLSFCICRTNLWLCTEGCSATRTCVLVVAIWLFGIIAVVAIVDHVAPRGESYHDEYEYEYKCNNTIHVWSNGNHIPFQ